MVPRKPSDISEVEEIPDSDSDDESTESALEQPSVEPEPDSPELDDMEEEYHTEESDEDVADENDESELEDATPSAPLLPAELLKPALPSPAYSAQNAFSIPWEQMTRKQKIAQRNRNRQSKKKAWNRLRRDTQGTGVIEAGKVAQLKRGVVAVKSKVKTGRVEKKPRPQTSGRQQLLEQRKRQVAQNDRELMRPPKKAKTQSKR